SHPILSQVPLAAAEHELRASRERLEAEIGEQVIGFAFPNGQDGDFTAEHVRILERSGYQYACTAQRGANGRGTAPFVLRGVGVGVASEARLDLKLALAETMRPCAA